MDRATVDPHSVKLLINGLILLKPGIKLALRGIGHTGNDLYRMACADKLRTDIMHPEGFRLVILADDQYIHP
jgi:hypothetical protein